MLLQPLTNNHLFYNRLSIEKLSVNIIHGDFPIIHLGDPPSANLFWIGDKFQEFLFADHPTTWKNYYKLLRRASYKGHWIQQCCWYCNTVDNYFGIFSATFHYVFVERQTKVWLLEGTNLIGNVVIFLSIIISTWLLLESLNITEVLPWLIWKAFKLVFV